MDQQTTPEIRTYRQRIKQELESAAPIPIGMRHFAVKYLEAVLQEDEHIQAAVFGRQKESEGFFGVVEGMLIATDKRVIFVDHLPGFTTMDEFPYESVSGVNVSIVLMNASVTLYTKVKKYRLSYTDHRSAKIFVRYLESRAKD